MTVEIEPENRFQIQLLTDFGIYQSESRFGQPWKNFWSYDYFLCHLSLPEREMVLKKMQEYHLRLSFLLSKAELWIQTLNTDKRDAKPDKLLLRCSKIKYICSIYSIGKKTIFISNKITTLKSSAWTVEPQIPEVFLIAAIFQFLLYFLGLTPILLWFVLGLISKMIRRREENEIKRRFSIDGRQFGFSLFSALKRLCILSHVIWAIWYQSFLKPFWHNINIIYFYL